MKIYILQQLQAVQANPILSSFTLTIRENQKCNCPHADGKRIICKHIVATYFTVLPKEAEKFYAEAMAYQEEEEKHQEELSDKVIEYVGKMKKVDLCQSLLELLFDGPEWQYDRFIREHGLDDDWY